MAIHKNIRLLGLHNFFTDFVLFSPIAILYFARITGSYALGMSIFSIAYVAGAVFEVPTGVVSDYLGRKKTIILGSLFSVLCIVLYAVSGSYWMLAVGAVGDRFGVINALIIIHLMLLLPLVFYWKISKYV